MNELHHWNCCTVKQFQFTKTYRNYFSQVYTWSPAALLTVADSSLLNWWSVHRMLVSSVSSSRYAPRWLDQEQILLHVLWLDSDRVVSWRRSDACGQIRTNIRTTHIWSMVLHFNVQIQGMTCISVRPPYILGTKVNNMASRVKGLVCLWHHEHGRTYRSHDFNGGGRSRVLVSWRSTRDATSRRRVPWLATPCYLLSFPISSMPPSISHQS